MYLIFLDYLVSRIYFWDWRWQQFLSFPVKLTLSIFQVFWETYILTKSQQLKISFRFVWISSILHTVSIWKLRAMVRAEITSTGLKRAILWHCIWKRNISLIITNTGIVAHMTICSSTPSEVTMKQKHQLRLHSFIAQTIGRLCLFKEKGEGRRSSYVGFFCMRQSVAGVMCRQWIRFL